MPLFVLFVFLVREHAQVDIASALVLEGVIEEKVGVGRHVLLFQANDHASLAVALDLGLVGRGIDRFDFRFGSFQVDLHGQVLDWLGGVFLGVEVVKVPDHFAVPLQNLSVVDLHFLFLPWFDREDSHLEEALTGVFEKGGVQGLANDVLVDLTGFCRVEQFGLLHLPVHFHGELVDPGALGHGKKEGSFHPSVGRIVENLTEFGDGDLILDRHLDVLGFQLQRKELADGTMRGDRSGRPRRSRMRRAGQDMGFVHDDQAVCVGAFPKSRAQEDRG